MQTLTELVQLSRQINPKKHCRKPPHPCISMGGSRKEFPDHPRNSTGAILHTCKSVPEEDDNWNRTEWRPFMARMMILPERMGCEPTDNDTGEVLATSLTEEMLPPSLGAILISDSTMAMSTYRVLRDGSVPSSRALVRKVMP